VLKWRLFSLLS